MTVNYIGSMPSSMLQSIIDMRSKLDDLQRQFGSGQKSTTYAGLGLDRGVSLSLRSQLAAASSYDSTIQNIGVRLSVAQTALDGVAGITQVVKNSLLQTTFPIDQSGQSGQQRAAASQLDQLLSVLNSRAGDHYLFSGKAVDQPAVVSADLIMNGDGIRAGLKQMIDERHQADLGANGLGRLSFAAPGGTSVTLTEDAAPPFGLKLSSAISTLSNATLTGPAGSPASLDVNFTGLPAAGEQITIAFDLPDGTTKNITLTATTNSPPGANEFTIGANATLTAGNLQTALSASLATLAATQLSAASAMTAADNFFNTDSSNPPQRVDGPPFDSATALIDGTSADTVMWYVGEDSATPARASSAARIDPSIVVNYGMRANEQGLRLAIQNVAVFAATSYSPIDPNANAAYKALSDRVGTALAGAPGQQKVSDIGAELAAAQASFSAAQARHSQTSSMLTDLLQKIETVPQEQVGAQILSLQTSLQASLQTTAMLSKLSLINYLPM